MGRAPVYGARHAYKTVLPRTFSGKDRRIRSRKKEGVGEQKLSEGCRRKEGKGLYERARRAGVSQASGDEYVPGKQRQEQAAKRLLVKKGRSE